MRCTWQWFNVAGRVLREAVGAQSPAGQRHERRKGEWMSLGKVSRWRDAPRRCRACRGRAGSAHLILLNRSRRRGDGSTGRWQNGEWRMGTARGAKKGLRRLGRSYDQRNNRREGCSCPGPRPSISIVLDARIAACTFELPLAPSACRSAPRDVCLL